MKRIQRGIRYQTRYMNAAEYDEVKRHNRVEKLVVSIISELDEPMCGPHRVRMHWYMEQAIRTLGLV